MYIAGIPAEFRPIDIIAGPGDDEATLIKTAARTLARAQWPHDVIRGMLAQAFAAPGRAELVNVLGQYVRFWNHPLYNRAENVLEFKRR
jgi:hypothetical protein